MGRGQYSRGMQKRPGGVGDAIQTGAGDAVETGVGDAIQTDTGDAYLVGVDVGGTAIKFGRYRLGARDLEGFGSLPTGAGRAPADVLADVAAAIRDLAAAAPGAAVGLGVGVPATLSRDGRIEVLPNFAPGWRDLDVAAALGAATGLPTVVLNDARAFTLAEARLGAAAGAHTAFGVTLGTGVGGGLVIDGRLHLGASGNAGEFGHHVHDPHGPRCGCGSHGCIETYASAPALVAAVMRPFAQGATPELTRLAGGRLDAVTPALIAAAAAAGDAICAEALERLALVLGVGLANVATLVSPERIVIGGGMAGLGETLFGPLRRVLAAYAPTAGARLPTLVPAALGDRAGALGAALHALDTAGAAR
jgi:glucokinase